MRRASILYQNVCLYRLIAKDNAIERIKIADITRKMICMIRCWRVARFWDFDLFDFAFAIFLPFLAAYGHNSGSAGLVDATVCRNGRPISVAMLMSSTRGRSSAWKYSFNTILNEFTGDIVEYSVLYLLPGR